METCLVNVVEPRRRRWSSASTGCSAPRMCEVAARAGAEVVRVDFDWGTPVTADRLLSAHPSTRPSSAWSTPRPPPASAPTRARSAPARATPCCWSTASRRSAASSSKPTTGASTSPTAGTQKCLGVPPGLSPITVNQRARDRFVERSQSWYLDLRLIGELRRHRRRDPRLPPHGPDLDDLLAARWPRRRSLDEGLEAVQRPPRRVRRGAPGGPGRPRVRAVRRRGAPPARAHHRRRARAASTRPRPRRTLLDRYGIEIGGGLGDYAGKVWRIGCMGHTARQRNVTMLLGALAEVLGR